MNLRNSSRTTLERCRPAVLTETKDTYLLECLNSFKLWTLKNDVSLTPSLKTYGFWESWITSWFTHNVEEGDFVIDVGANCGYYTMLFEKLVGPSGLVVAYECNPEYVMLLEETKHTNNANYKVEPVALSNKAGTIDLIYPGDYTGSASIAHGFDPKWGEPHSIKVETTTLDSELSEMDTPALIKIDAESAEEMIWNGAQEVLHRHDAPVVALEYSPTGVYSKQFDEQLFDTGNMTTIGFDGIEHPINVEFLKNLRDWSMIVWRKK